MGKQAVIHNYITMLAHGWSGGTNVFTGSGIKYTSGSGGMMNIFKMVTRSDLVKQQASIMFWATTADIQLADRLLLYRVTDTSSNILKSDTNARDEIRHIPAAIT